MNWNYRVDPVSGSLLVRADGLVTGDELLRGAVAVANDPGFGDFARVLLDFSRVTEWTVTAEDLELFARHPRYSIDSRSAAIVRFGLPQGLFGFWAESAKPDTARVFHGLEEAVAWLNEGRAVGERLSPAAAGGA